MYIRAVQVDGYGALQNISVTLDAPVTVVFGPNEAGKSTLLRFMRSMLYGIPTRKDPVERGEPVFGGRHGGRLTVRTGDGRELLLERYADGTGARKTAGGLVVRDESGTELRWTQAEWERHALGGVSERLFRQLFAVSLDELHELLTLQGEEIGNFLYHAGLAGGASLAETRRKLAAEMNKLYRPQGSTQEMNRVLASVKEIEADIRQSRGGIVLFHEMTQELLATEERIERIGKSIPPLAAKMTELHTVLEVRELWLRRQVLLADERDSAARLPDPSAPPLPEEAAAEWSGLQRRRQEAAERLQKAGETVRQRRQQLEALQWDEPLLARAAELEKLEAMREAAAARQEEKESVAAELRLLDETIETLLPRVSPDWEEADLQAFGSVLSERDPLRRLQQAWGETERAVERLKADAGRLQRQRDALQVEMSATGGGREPSDPVSGSLFAPPEPFGAYRPQTRDTLQHAWNALEDDLRRLERVSFPAAGQAPSAPAGRASRSGRSVSAARAILFAVSGLLGISAVVVVLIGLLTSHGGTMPQAYLIGTAVLAVSAVFSGWLGVRRNVGTVGNAYPHPDESLRNRISEGKRRVDDRLRELLADPQAASTALWRETSADEETWKRLRQSVQEHLEAMVNRERERNRTEERQRKTAELDREKASLEAEIRQSADRMNDLQTEWTSWLRERRLPLSLTPDSLPELLNLAEQGQTHLRRRARAQERLTALEQMHAAFRETAAALFAVCPPPDTMAADPALSVSWLYRRAAEQRTRKEEAQRSERSLEEAEAAESETRQAVVELEAAIGNLIRQTGAGDESALEQRLRVDERRRSFIRERREIDLRLEAGRSAQSAAILYELLESHDEAAIALLCRQAEEAWQTAERERTELLDRRGRLAQELERLQREAETEDRLMRLSELENKLERLTERYAVLALSDRLLQETKAVFEEERQPEVLRLASRYFSGMTGSAYTRITVPADSQAIFAETADRRLTDSSFLSRGAQEQLYLSMRFALAEAASRDVPLPLLLDDLFVHFDEKRLRETVPVLAEIAQTRQVILFTCHRHVADTIGRGLPSASIMNWGGPAGAARSAARGPGSSGTASPS